MSRVPQTGEIYRHFKNKLYQIVTVATHSETGEKLVIYQALYGDFGVYARPLEMFVSEVDHVKYPEVEQKYRFEKVGPVTEPEKTEETKEDTKEEMMDAGDAWNDKTEESETGQQEEGWDAIHPSVLEFLDTDSFEKRYNILVSLRDQIDDQMINTLAIALDVVIPEGRIEDRYNALKNCLRTRQKYESTRLR